MQISCFANMYTHVPVQVRQPSPVHLQILYLYMSVLMTAHSRPRQRSFAAAVHTDRLALFILDCLINLTLGGGDSPSNGEL